MNSSVSRSKSVPFGIYCLISLLAFSMAPFLFFLYCLLSLLGRFVFVRCFEPINEDRPAGVPKEAPAALIVAVGVVWQTHCAGELPDDGGKECLDSVLGDDVEIVEGDEKFVELRLLSGPFER